jgi:midasin (ATPase involved in ribosome maturation)
MAPTILEAMARTPTACSQSLPPLLIEGEGGGTSMGKKMMITIILTAERTTRKRRKTIV